MSEMQCLLCRRQFVREDMQTNLTGDVYSICKECFRAEAKKRDKESEEYSASLMRDLYREFEMRDKASAKVSIKETPVVPRRQELMCACGSTMTFTGESLMTYPPKYVHECTSCKIRHGMSCQFPRVVYVEDKRDE